MEMSCEEIKEKYKRNCGTTKREQEQYKGILADLNGCNVKTIEQILNGTHKLVRAKPKKEEKPNIDGLIEVLIKEAITSYICSMREDNERLANLQNRQGKVGNYWDRLDNRIEVNEQKIQLLKEYVYG